MSQPIRIDSPTNARIKTLVKLRDARTRRQLGRTLIEGAREVERAFAAGHPVSELYLGFGVADAGISAALRRQAEAVGAMIFSVSPTAFAKASYRDSPDGVLAVAAPVAGDLDDLLATTPDPIVVAEGLEKPGNLGAMLRTLDGAGAALIVCDPATDLGNPNVIRASTGAVFSVPVAIATGDAAVQALHARGYTVVAADPAASRAYWDVDMRGPLALVVGSEAHGLSPLWRRAATTTVAIPMRGRADSLNAAQSATLLVYEALRQRRPAPAVS